MYFWTVFPSDVAILQEWLLSISLVPCWDKMQATGAHLLHSKDYTCVTTVIETLFCFVALGTGSVTMSGRSTWRNSIWSNTWRIALLMPLPPFPLLVDWHSCADWITLLNARGSAHAILSWALQPSTVARNWEVRILGSLTTWHWLVPHLGTEGNLVNCFHCLVSHLVLCF